jgi:exodeoxyribonuclease VII small subunit
MVICPLDEALGCFEEGVKSAARCRELLREVEGRVELLLKDAAGNLTTAPLAAEDEEA